MTVDDFSVLHVTRLEVRLRACEPVSLPPFLGSTLRGALGHALKQAVCVVDHGDCSRCPIAFQCTYPYLFETPAPPGIAQLRGQRHAPLPFILEPPIVVNPVKRILRLPAARVPDARSAVATAGDRGQFASHCGDHPGYEASSVTSVVFPDQPKRFSLGEDLSFGLTLVGRAIEFLPYVIFAIAEMARRGLGANRGQFDLKEVWLKGAAGTRERIYSVDSSRLTVPPHVSRPLSDLMSERVSDLQGKKVANSEAEGLSGSAHEKSRYCLSASQTLEEAVAERLSELRSATLNDSDSNGRELTTQSTNGGREYRNGRQRDGGPDAKREDRLKLRFLTPARIRVQGDLQTGVTFELLIRNLLRRVSTLAAVHGRSHLDLDYRGLIERAESVRTLRSRLKWWDLERYSNRQAEKLKVGGLIGEIEYQGDAVEDYMPLLVAGELLQVGAGASYGLGRYELLRR